MIPSLSRVQLLVLPQFNGELMKSPITGADELVADAAKQLKALIIGSLVVGTFVVTVVGVLFGIYYFRCHRFWHSSTVRVDLFISS